MIRGFKAEVIGGQEAWPVLDGVRGYDLANSLSTFFFFLIFCFVFVTKYYDLAKSQKSDVGCWFLFFSPLVPQSTVPFSF